MKAMILAAGLGSRLKPWTDFHPKALAEVNGQSLLQRNIQYLQQFGIQDIIVNVHHFAEQILTAIEKNNGWGSTITISDETDQVLETGGGLKKAADYFQGESDFVVMNADILTDMNLADMLLQHQMQKPLATLAVSERISSRYFLFLENGLLGGWKNIKTGEEKIMRLHEKLYPKAFSGIHVISTRLFPLIKQTGKFSLVDVYLSLAADYPIAAFDHTGCQLIDVGKPDSVEKAEKIFT
jgi:NDP-sugar pyrophosphorylase family protein